MADLTLNNSTYQVGTQDTATTLVDNVDTVKAQHPNGANSAILQIETILGNGPSLKGTKADLATRLAVRVANDGTLAGLTVPEGGTGVATVTAGAVLAGNGTSALVNSGAGAAGQPLVSGGSGAPSWGTGLVYLGPASCASGSTRSHEGAVTISSNQNLSGIHFYSTFTLNSGIVLTLPAHTRRLVIIATSSITINGTINASGAGGRGGSGAGVPGETGTDQPGGGGGNGFNGNPAAGGAVTIQGCVLQAGGGTGGSGTQVTSNAGLLFEPSTAMGGAGGGGGAADSGPGIGGSGGAGGGSIVLIAPTVTLAATATFNTSGGSGTGPGGGDGGDGGGGGAGNVYILTHSYTDNGATFTLTGGGTGGGGTAGGSGATGIKQITVF